MTTPQLVTIFGGSGFLGRYVARRMARRGWLVRVAVRRPNEALFVRTYGEVGQVEPVQANIRDEASTRRAITSAQAVVNCVGTFDRGGRNNFNAVHVEGAARIARLAAEEGCGRLVHVSAIGADPDSSSRYGRSKAEGEQAVTAAFARATILRPSILFGHEDQFFNRFAAMARFSPVIPLVGAETRFQPVFVDDVAAAAEQALIWGAPGIYELGGPEIATFRELIERMLVIIRRRRLILPLPFWLAQIQASLLDTAAALSLGLVRNTVLTRDQVEMLKRDNVVAPGAKGFADLGLTPTAMDAVLESYLYAYRPYGQFTEITDSAAHLRAQD
ncbi:MAG: complex I NDUFA9 subunit family protein [Alphaproteobacteria bacterium]|nr:MAG: complex I NDUFA9 subunit family protein [Alphaproteobacteria bacterium]